MENASKALIIAGAILIAVILVSLGILVFNIVNKPIDQAQTQADAQAIELFNSKFAGYFGKNKSSASVKSLMTLISSSNSADTKHQIEYVNSIPGGGDTIGNMDTTKITNGTLSGNDIISSATYTITPVYADSNNPKFGLKTYITQKGYLYLIGIKKEP